MSENDFDFNVMSEDIPEEVEPVQICKFNSDILTKDVMEIPACDLHGKLLVMHFYVEATEDYIAGSTFSLCKVPASEVRIIWNLSRIGFLPQPFEGSFGWTKHRTRRREIIDADPEGFDAFLNESCKMDSLEGFFIVFTATKAGEKGDRICGDIIYVKM